MNYNFDLLKVEPLEVNDYFWDTVYYFPNNVAISYRIDTVVDEGKNIYAPFFSIGEASINNIAGIATYTNNMSFDDAEKSIAILHNWLTSMERKGEPFFFGNFKLTKLEIQ